MPELPVMFAHRVISDFRCGELALCSFLLCGNPSSICSAAGKPAEQLNL